MDSKVVENFCKNKFTEMVNKALSHLGKEAEATLTVYGAPYLVRITLKNREEIQGTYGTQYSFSKLFEIEKLLKKAFEEFNPQHFFLCESYSSSSFNFQFSVDSYPMPPKSVAVQLIKDLGEEKK